MKCETCNADNNRLLVNSNSCPPKDGHYEEKDNPTAPVCDNACLTCTEKTDRDCIVCSEHYHKVDGRCIPEDGWYEDPEDEKVKKCHKECLAC